eukprot:2069475-Amphidinium_carterae.1
MLDIQRQAKGSLPTKSIEKEHYPKSRPNKFSCSTQQGSQPKSLEIDTPWLMLFSSPIFPHASKFGEHAISCVSAETDQPENAMVKAVRLPKIETK